MKKNNIENSKLELVDTEKCLKNENKQHKQWESIIDDYKKSSKTDLLDKVNFENKLDFEILERLPLSQEQKEILLIDVLSHEYPEDKVIQSYRQKILDKYNEEYKIDK